MTPPGRRDYQSKGKVVDGYRLILEGLGLDWQNDPHLQNTPERAARALLDELCIGLVGPEPNMTTFPLKGKSEMVVSRGIPVQSLCAHHLLPFVGEATVAYIPLNKVLGLSKLSRAVEYMARRPQVQEELTTGIADFLLETLVEPRLPEVEMEGWGVGVVIRAKHFCVELRGAKHSSDMVTSALRGEFLKPEVRAEFLSLAGVM